MTDLFNYLADSTLFWWAFAIISFLFILLTGFVAFVFAFYPKTLSDVFIAMFFSFVTLFLIMTVSEIAYYALFKL